MSNVENSPSSNIQIVSEEKPEHNCGIGLKYIFGETVKSSNHKDIGEMGYALQHRGQRGAGSSWCEDDAIGREVMDGLISRPFINSINHTPKRWQMIHTRYGTSGGYKDYNIQPCVAPLPDGEEIHAAFNGNIPAAQRLRKYLPEEINNQLPSDTSDSALGTFTLQQLAYQSNSFDEAVQKFAELDEIKHSATNAIIGKGKDAYVIRDGYGFHPLFMAQKDNAFYIGSETVAFDRINIRKPQEFPTASIMKLSPEGAQWLSRTESDRHECAYEWFYFSHPNSRMQLSNETAEEMVLMDYRMETGRMLHRESPVIGANLIVGMPDSGLHAAYGFAEEAGVQYYPGITRNHYGEEGSQRSFLRDDTDIGSIVIDKLMIANSKQWRGKNVVIVDDSIVRGNTLSKVTKALYSLGAKEVHGRAASPPTKDTCHLGVSIREPEELIYYRHKGDLKKIAEEIGADSVGYLSWEAFIKSGRGTLNVPANRQEIFLHNQLCGGCMTGLHPVNLHGQPLQLEGSIYRSSKRDFPRNGSIPIPLSPVA